MTLAVADMDVASSEQVSVEELAFARGCPGSWHVLMMAVSGLLVWGLLGVSFWVAMLVGATVASADPIIATTIGGSSRTR